MNKEELPQRSYPGNNQYLEDDIQLIDYLRVMWKWKWLIIGGTLLCVIIAAVVISQKPKIYEITMMIEPPVIGVDSVGNYVYAGSAGTIMEKIAQGAYRQKLNETPAINQKTNLKFASSKQGNFISIRSQWSRENIDLGLEASRRLISLIEEDCSRIVDYKLMDYTRKITMKENEIKKISLQRKAMEERIKRNVSEISRLKKVIDLKYDGIKTLQEREKEVILEIEDMKKNAGVLEEERKKLSQTNSPSDGMTLVLYSSMIQQDLMYLGQWKEELRNTRTRIGEVENNIEALRNDINDHAAETERIKLQKTEGLNVALDDVRVQLNTLQLEKGIISNIKIIQAPEVPSGPVKPKMKQIVLLAGVVALFMLVFLAFFIEYIKKASRE